MLCSCCASYRKHTLPGRKLPRTFLPQGPFVGGHTAQPPFLRLLGVWEQRLLDGGGYCGIRGWYDWWSLTCSSRSLLPPWRQSSPCLRSIPFAGKPYKMGTSSPNQGSLFWSCRVAWLGNSSSVGVNVAC